MGAAGTLAIPTLGSAIFLTDSLEVHETSTPSIAIDKSKPTVIPNILFILHSLSLDSDIFHE